MRMLKRGSALRVLIPVFLAVSFALPGCGGSPDDLSRAASEGTALKTPSDVLRESNAEHGVPEKVHAKAATDTKGRK